MAEVLLINPRKRVKRRASAAPKKRRVARRKNPAPVVSTLRRVTRRRRANPVAQRRVARRRNPIGGSVGISAKGIVSMLKDAAVGGAGAFAFETLYQKVSAQLPASLRITSGRPSAGHAVKALATVVLGKLLKKPTRGLSEKLAAGSLTVQFSQLIAAAMPQTATATGVGYWNPAAVTNGNNRIGPMSQRSNTVGAYMRPGGQTPLLNAYERPGSPSPLLSSFRSARERERSVR